MILYGELSDISKRSSCSKDGIMLWWNFYRDIIKNLAVTTSKIAADAIDGTKIADDAINSEHYADYSIDHVHLSGNCIDGDNIQDDVVNSEHIAAGAVDLEHMSSESVDEDNLQISNAGSNGQFLSKQSGNTGGLTWADAGGTVADGCIYENAQTISNNYTISTNYNALSAGPITISATLTIPSGSVYTIV